MAIVENLWSNWLYVALCAPFFFALVNILDIYFVDSVYEDEWDGVLIASFFQALPWLFVPLGIISLQAISPEAFWLAFLAGGMLILSYFFYFKALFISNDAVIVSAVWNLGIPLVPFFAWFIVSEKLQFIHYVGIALAFIGVSVFTLNKKIKERKLSSVLKAMLGAVIFFSLSLVIQKRVYEEIGDDFWTGFLLFSLGATLIGFVLSSFDRKPFKERMSHVFKLSNKYFIIFILAECANLIGLLFSQRAVDLSPSVSFVEAIGSLAPIYVMLISFILAFTFHLFSRKAAKKMYEEQLIGFRTKVVACIVIAVGIYLIS